MTDSSPNSPKPTESPKPNEPSGSARDEGRQSTVPLDRFELLEPLGRGASATVYRARDRLIGRVVALKRLDLLEPSESPRAFEGEDRSDPLAETDATEASEAFEPSERSDGPQAAAARQRFLTEARHAGALSHPNIVTVYDVVEDEDRPGTLCLAMEFVDGTDLRQALESEERTDLDTVMAIVDQVASALDYLHTQGFVHCDLKPANLLLTPDGRVKLTDFGIAQQISIPDGDDTDVFGTPAYMAPERLLGEATGPRAEVYSLGVMIFELLTRRRPFEAPSVERLIHRLVHQEPTPLADHRPELGRRLGPVLEKALARDASERFATAGELAQALGEAIKNLRQDRALAETESTIVLDPTLLNRLRASLNQRRWLSALRRFRLRPSHLAILLLLGIAFGIALTLRLINDGDSGDIERVIMPPPSEYTKAEDARRLLERGRKLLEDGDPATAITMFELVSVLEPSLAEEANAELEQVRGLFVDEPPPRPRRSRPPREVVASARESLGKLEGFDDILALLDEVSSQAEIPETQPAEEVVAEAFLMVDVESEASRGTLTLYVDEVQMLRRQFHFFERGRLFFNKIPIGGRFQELLSLEPSADSQPTSLGVYIQREGEGAMFTPLDIELVTGIQSVLEIRIPTAGEPEIFLR